MSCGILGEKGFIWQLYRYGILKTGFITPSGIWQPQVTWPDSCNTAIWPRGIIPFIAASALTQNFILVTNNKKYYKRVNGLDVENWTKD